MSKIGMLLGAGVGYVLGARAGRERYDEIEQRVRGVWKDPRVQQKKSEAEAKASEMASKATDRSSTGSPSDAGPA